MPPRRSRKAEPSPVEGATSADVARPRPPPPVQDRMGKVLEAIRGFHATHLLAFGVETGAIAQVKNREPHGINAKELAEDQGWTEDYARLFLETAYSLGFLELASEAGITPRARFRFAPEMDRVLAEESDAYYVGGYPRLHILAGQDYKRLPDLFRAGKAFPYALHGEDFLRSAANATRALPAYFLERILPGLPELRRRLEAGVHILDVGCGAGWAVAEFSERFPKCRVLGIDAEPNAIEMARTLITMRNLGSRADARLVRGEEIDYEAEFDVATLFLVLHAIPPKQKPLALSHAARALKRGGTLLLVDEAYPETPEEFRNPQQQMAVVTQWVEGPWGHRLSTRSEHRVLLQEAGLRVLRETSAGRYHALLAEKA